MIEAGASVSDDPPATMQELPAPGGGEYLMCRLEPGVTPRGWDEWAQWVVVDSGGLPVGYIAESHELVAHNTWGPATYTAAHNPAGHDGCGAAEVASIVYGFPVAGSALLGAVEASDVFLGGCVIEPGPRVALGNFGLEWDAGRVKRGGWVVGRGLIIGILGVVIGAGLGVLAARTPEASVVTVGKLTDFAPGSVHSLTIKRSFFDFQPSEAGQNPPAVAKRSPATLFLVLDQTGGVLALLARDTHSRCRLINVQGKPGVLEGVSDAAWFADPCHGASYDQTGACLAGPCPRGLDRFSVGITEGKVVIDVGLPLIGPTRTT